ncbi:proteasome subunit beta type-1-like [Convolutriloba macropyga]|uniref:proteasome subunit beta type-1-like n=1 Tax=Convolutriloba macropyga TaxID=536237 RepID=UPI003F51C80C
MSRRWSPYDMNGGSIVAISGEDFAVIGSDTRLSTGYTIWTREQRRIHKVSDSTVVGQVGFHGDCQFLMKILETRSKMYQFDHGRQLSCSASASVVSKMLYSRRFFPLYVYNIVVGCEKDQQTGKYKGMVYGYDPVGCYDLEPYGALGSAGALLQPLLDNQLGQKNMENCEFVPVTRERAISLIKDVFISAAERDIYSGDNAHIVLVDEKGIHEQFMPLRRD